MSRILVVDDEPDQRFLLRRLLERAGHEVSEAHHGAAALQAVRESAPDLVVTDVMMPVMDGVELIRCLRGDPATAYIPILAASGDTHLADGAETGRELDELSVDDGPDVGGGVRFLCGWFGRLLPAQVFASGGFQ